MTAERLVPVEPTALDQLEAVYDWMREPDYGDTFTQNDLVEWLNRRPSGLFMTAIGALRKAERDAAAEALAALSQPGPASEGDGE